jgi:hypothetical protein
MIVRHVLSQILNYSQTVANVDIDFTRHRSRLKLLSNTVLLIKRLSSICELHVTYTQTMNMINLLETNRYAQRAKHVDDNQHVKIDRLGSVNVTLFGLSSVT